MRENQKEYDEWEIKYPYISSMNKSKASKIRNIHAIKTDKIYKVKKKQKES
ncbi:hypothetical protein [Garciella nitratireducens]|uniref:hypothetical protein n=1 Tax=Garciella nitratireducens TaxID=218205 RepID=UPI00135643D9|nr:hypothetical protein [Garciella nitratireducens]